MATLLQLTCKSKAATTSGMPTVAGIGSEVMSHDIGVPERRVNMAKEAHDAYAALRAFNQVVRDGLGDETLLNLVYLRASQINGCSYCVVTHARDARKAGESDHRLDALAAWREAPYFTERERAALALTEAVTLVADTRVPDDLWEAAAAHLSPAELSHLVLAVGVINTFNRISIASRLPAPSEPAG